MAKFLVTYYESYSRGYEVEASSKEEAEEIVRDDILEGRREYPDNCLKKHRGHQVYITSYGDPEHPANICLECEDCGEVVLDAELYTICAREDASSKGL